MSFQKNKNILAQLPACALYGRSHVHKCGAIAPHHIAWVERGDLEFWSAAQKLQMTAAWVSQNGFAKTTKVRWDVAIAVLTGVSARRAKEKQ
ncbi:MAG: hypothetical protein JSU07_03680 [Bacteroidetes bacterium]|nr:hypothetical protein [Bacteroidota bacterium]